MGTTGPGHIANLRVKAMPPTITLVRALLSFATLVVLVGCGATVATNSVSTPTQSTASASSAVASGTRIFSPSPATTPSPAVPGDVAGAKQAALGLIVPDPSGPQGHWVDCSQLDGWASCPLSTEVEARLDLLRSQGYFSDVGGCGEEYITHTQNGLNNGPEVLSAIAGANGSVTVVIQRAPGLPNLTAVMTIENGTWLASDLASGSGPAASIFSAKPNC
jgi:hypothetical protein